MGLIPKFVETDSLPPAARPELVEGLFFLFNRLEDIRTVLRQAQDVRWWVGLIEFWYK